MKMPIQKHIFSLFLFSILFSFAGLSAQEQLLLWDFEDTVSPLSINEDIIASDISISAGSISFQNGADEGGKKIGYASSWSINNEFDANEKYLEYSFSPQEGYKILLSSLSFKFGRTDKGPKKVAIQYSFDDFNTEGNFLLEDAAVNSTNTGSLDYIIISDNLPPEINSSLTIRIWGYNTDSGNFRFNDFTVNGFIQPEDYDIVFPPSFSPKGGSFTEDVEVSLTSLTEGADIYYKFSEESDWILYVEKLLISETTTVFAYAKKEGMDDSSIKNATFEMPVKVASIAELRMHAGDDSYYKITGEVVFTFFTDNAYNQAYIQDKDAKEAILLHDADAKIISDYDLYAGIVNLTGSITNFRNMLLFVPAKDPGPASSTGNDAYIETVSFETLNTAFSRGISDYQGQLVYLEDVLFITEDEEFTEGGNYQLRDISSNTINLRTPYPNKDYLGANIPKTWQNIKGVILQEDEHVIVIPRFTDDFEESDLNNNLVATPDINPKGGRFTNPIEISISTSTEDATIFYTFEGADADESEWHEYKGVFTIKESCTLWVIAKKEGWINSPLAKETYIFPDPMEVPFITKFNNKESWNPDTSGGSYGLKEYTEGGWSFTAESSIRDTDICYDESDYSLRNRGDLVITNELAINDLGGFSLFMLNWRSSPAANREVLLSLDGGENYNTIGLIDANWATNIDEFHPFTFYLPDGAQNFNAGQIIIILEGSGANNNRMRIGAFKALEETDFVLPPIISPDGGNVFADIEVSIECPTPDAQIYYRTSEAEDWTLYQDKFTLSETTTIFAYAVKEGSQDSELTIATFSFPIEVDDIAILRKGKKDGSYYKLKGEAIITFMTSFRNQKFIQDETAAILIDDPDGNITTAYSQYDGIKDLTGFLTTNFNMLQLSVVTDPGEPVSSDNKLSALEINISDLNRDYQAVLVSISNVLISHETKTVFEQDSYIITDSQNNSGVLRVNYEDLPYLNEEFPTTNQDITGVVIEFQETMQIMPRSWADFKNTNVVDLDKFSSSLVLYPNPVKDILSVSSSELIEHIQIININGSVVKSVRAGLNHFNINIEKLPAGLYFVRLTTIDGDIINKKIIIE